MKTDIVEAVKSKYGSIAASGLSSEHAGVRAVAEAFGYSPEELASIPAEANMGLSCGNPTATAHLKPGEIVVDLGCGGGLDVLLAAKKVGPTGRAIGIDMTPQMLELARKNAEKAGVSNAEFHHATVDKLPLPTNSVDCVISNCVINLAPDKPAVFREIARVLKPGGRLAVSDIALKKPLPPEVGADLMAYVGCVAGAILVEDYRRELAEAGFSHVEVIDTGADLNAYAKVENQSGCCSQAMSPASSLPVVADYSGCCGSATPTAEADLHGRLASLLRKYDVNSYAASVRVFAVKPGAQPVPSSQVVKDTAMTTLQVFDRPMCCPTGVCGPAVDPVLPKFASDLAWLKEQGVAVERYNLAQQPQAFVAHADVRDAISEGHEQVLPLVRVNGVIVGKGGYPSREQLARWCGVSISRPLAVAESTGGACCGPSGCC